MKILKISVLMLMTLLSCSTNKTTNDGPKDNSVIGQWQLSETKIGFPSEWQQVDNGYYFTFNVNGTFTSNKFQECETGSFTFTSNELILDFDCPNFTAGIESPPGTFTEVYVFENENLILTPSYLSCPEECLYKFKKVASD